MSSIFGVCNCVFVFQGFQISGLGFVLRVPDLEFQVSGFGFRVSGFGFRGAGFDCQVY